MTQGRLDIRKGVRRLKPPREHGFWAMLVLALTVGVSAAPGWRVAFLAACLGLFSIGLAMWLGRRIRRSPWLQALSGPLLASLIVPIGVVGGESLQRMLILHAPLSFAFLSTTLAVQSILYRAQKKETASLRAAYGALGISLIAVALGLGYYAAEVALGLALCAFFVIALLIVRPSARRMKRIGFSALAVQLSVACLILL